MAYKKPLTARGGVQSLTLRTSNFFYQRPLTWGFSLLYNRIDPLKKENEKSSILVQKQKNSIKYFGILHKNWRYSSIYLDTSIPTQPYTQHFHQTFHQCIDWTLM